MEAAAGAASTVRGALLSTSSSQSSSRKEWRVVSEQSVRSAGNEEMDRTKFSQSDERTIYEVQQGRQPLDMVDFCSLQMDGVAGGIDGDYEQKLHSYARKREELLQMEIELRAQMISRSEIMEAHSRFEARINEKANAAAKLQEQLHERDQRIADLERIMEEKERELHAVRLDNEAAWAKEDLLREQSKELANFRREHDNSEAERAHLMKQIHDLQEHIRDKDRQLIELQEQHRTAQDTILYKDEQLREAQAWITRVQEMDAIQSSTNHTLQAELRDRTEQYNQLWLACQRQFAEMERVHMQTIQQLQHELAGAKDKSSTYNEESQTPLSNSKETPHLGQNNGSHLEANGGGSSVGNSGSVANGTSGDALSFALSGNLSAQANHAAGLPMSPSLLGVPSYLPPGQVTAVHPFIMHQQGVNHSVSVHASQSHVGQFPSVPPISSSQHWQGPQAVSEVSSQQQQPPSQAESKLDGEDSNFGYELAANGPGHQPEHLGSHMNHVIEDNAVILSSINGTQALESSEHSYLAAQGQQTLQQISSKFHDALKLAQPEQTLENKENNDFSLTAEGLENQSLATEPSGSVASPPVSNTPTGSGNFDETTMSSAPNAVLPEAHVSAGQTNSLHAGKISEVALLDERSLLACIVRTIPAGGRIRISSTLPNRLGKMLAPLHWHDYRKKYGKLDEFVGSHPELFFIEGDYILLREGAQGIIAATAAVAKVAAAAAEIPHSSFYPSVALTPMAQATNRLKRAPSIETKSIRNVIDVSSQLSLTQSQHLNGVAYNNVRILSKSKDAAVNGPDGQSSMPKLAENGSSNFQSMGHFNARSGEFFGRQQSRAVANPMVSRR